MRCALVTGVQTWALPISAWRRSATVRSPSHIIAPAIHVLKQQVAESFYAMHKDYDAARPLEEPRALLDEARAVLRQKYLDADVGITGATFLISERSEERRVGKECVRTCRSRWSP